MFTKDFLNSLAQTFSTGVDVIADTAKNVYNTAEANKKKQADTSLFGKLASFSEEATPHKLYPRLSKFVEGDTKTYTMKDIQSGNPEATEYMKKKTSDLAMGMTGGGSFKNVSQKATEKAAAAVAPKVSTTADDASKMINTVMKRFNTDWDTASKMLKQVGVDVTETIKKADDVIPPSSADDFNSLKNDLVEAMNTQIQTAKQTAKKVSVEKGVRAGKAEEVAQSGVTGEERVKQYMGQFKGKYSERPSIEPLTNIIGEERFVQLENAVIDSGLKRFDTLPAIQALREMSSGRTPNKSQLEALKKVFGEDLPELIPPSNLNKAEKVFVEAMNTPRTLMASGDMSGFRQAVVALVTHPQYTPKFFRDMFKYWGAGKGEQNFAQEMSKIRELENYPEMRMYGVDLQGLVGAREEAYLGAGIAEKIPGIKIPVRASERAYTGSLTNLRARMANNLFASEKALQERKVFTPEQIEKHMYAIANVVNDATGRGRFGKPFSQIANVASGGTISKHQQRSFEKNIESLASAGLFSPKLIASRLSYINPWRYVKVSEGRTALIERWRGAAQMVGASLTLVGLVKMAKHNGYDVDIETNSKSSDFMKIKMGNTRIDLTGGQAAYIRLLAQLITQETKSVSTGKTNKLGVGYKSDDSLSLIGRFAKSKLSPAANVSINSLLTGKNFQGQPTSLPQEMIGSISPLYVQDVAKAISAEGFDEKMAIPFILGFFGAGTQTYDSPTQKVKNKIENKKQELFRKQSGFSEEMLRRLTGYKKD